MARGGGWDTVTILTMKLTEIVVEKALVISPPVDSCKVTNIFVDPITGKLYVEYEDTPVKEGE